MQKPMSIEFAPGFWGGAKFVVEQRLYNRVSEKPMFIGFAPGLGVAQKLAQTGARPLAPTCYPFRG
jgi:hypothetical protein